jgi:hypothetical protein
MLGLESGMADRDEDAALWDRYRDGLAAEPEPDPMVLAAYAENRLSEQESAPVESWLARNPERLDDVLAARAALDAGPIPLAAAATIRAAQAALPGTISSRILLLRTAAWGSVAAGFLAACLFGYEAGVATGGHTVTAATSAAHELGFVASTEGIFGAVMGLSDAGEEL